LAASCLGLVVLVLLASKEGAGQWHLMPTLPVGALLLAMAHDRLDAARSPRRDPLFGALDTSIVALATVAASLTMLLAVYNLLKPGLDKQQIRDAVADIHDINAEEGPVVAMGYGADDNYHLSWLRPLLRFQDVLTLDAAALMDMRASRLALPEATLDCVRRGAIQAWLIPKGDPPFALTSKYDLLPLFNEEFRTAFLDHYKPTRQLRCYDVWTYRGRP
jgi:hypothetical protein